MFLRFTHVGGVDVIGPWGSISVSNRSTAPTMIPSRCQIGLSSLNRVSEPDRKSCIVKCLCFIVCLVCFIVWGVCHLRLENVELSRLGVRWGTCASLTSLGLYLIQRVICLRLARIFFFSMPKIKKILQSNDNTKNF